MRGGARLTLRRSLKSGSPQAQWPRCKSSRFSRLSTSQRETLMETCTNGATLEAKATEGEGRHLYAFSGCSHKLFSIRPVWATLQCVVSGTVSRHKSVSLPTCD